MTQSKTLYAVTIKFAGIRGQPDNNKPGATPVRHGPELRGALGVFTRRAEAEEYASYLRASRKWAEPKVKEITLADVRANDLSLTELEEA